LTTTRKDIDDPSLNKIEDRSSLGILKSDAMTNFSVANPVGATFDESLFNYHQNSSRIPVQNVEIPNELEVLKEVTTTDFIHQNDEVESFETEDEDDQSKDDNDSVETVIPCVPQGLNPRLLAPTPNHFR
jgi:hypothetical protein